MANLRGLNTASGGYALSSQKRGADRLSSAPLSVAGGTTPPGAGHLPDRCKGPLAQSPLFLYAVFSSVSSSYSYSDGWPGLFSSSSSGSPSAVFSSSFSSSSLSFSIFISVFPAFSSIFVSFFSFCLSFSFSSSPMPAPRPHAPVRATARATRIAPIASLERLESSTLLLKKPLSFLLWPHRTAKPNGPGSASIRLRWPDEPPLLARGAYPIGATRSLAQSPLLPLLLLLSLYLLLYLYLRLPLLRYIYLRLHFLRLCNWRYILGYPYVRRLRLRASAAACAGQEGH